MYGDTHLRYMSPLSLRGDEHKRKNGGHVRQYSVPYRHVPCRYFCRTKRTVTVKVTGRGRPLTRSGS